MMRQTVKKEQRRIFNSSDDSAIMKHILATHAPDGREVDLNLLLGAIEETFHHAIPADIDSIINKGANTRNINALPGEESTSSLGSDDTNGINDGLAYDIHNISNELFCKCSGGRDAHTSTMIILNMLSSYSWEAKVVISLGAFAVNFGEFWLVAQLCATNSLAKSIALLKHMPNIMEHYKLLKTRFDAINLLINSTLDVTKCIITFKNLPYQYIQDTQTLKSTITTQVPTATYWSIKSMVACTSQLTSLLGMNYDMYITATSEATDLSILAHKVHNIHENLKSTLDLCYQKTEEKQHDEHHMTRVRIFGAREEKQHDEHHMTRVRMSDNREEKQHDEHHMARVRMSEAREEKKHDEHPMTRVRMYEAREEKQHDEYHMTHVQMFKALEEKQHGEHHMTRMRMYEVQEEKQHDEHPMTYVRLSEAREEKQHDEHHMTRVQMFEAREEKQHDEHHMALVRIFEVQKAKQHDEHHMARVGMPEVREEKQHDKHPMTRVRLSEVREEKPHDENQMTCVRMFEALEEKQHDEHHMAHVRMYEVQEVKQHYEHPMTRVRLSEAQEEKQHDEHHMTRVRMSEAREEKQRDEHHITPFRISEARPGETTTHLHDTQHNISVSRRARDNFTSHKQHPR